MHVLPPLAPADRLCGVWCQGLGPDPPRIPPRSNASLCIKRGGYGKSVALKEAPGGFP